MSGLLACGSFNQMGLRLTLCWGVVVSQGYVTWWDAILLAHSGITSTHMSGIILPTKSPWKGQLPKGFSGRRLYIILPNQVSFGFSWSVLARKERHIGLDIKESVSLTSRYQDDYAHSRDLQPLMSREPGAAWTTGQWMTKRQGGSDVSMTETIATYNPDRSVAVLTETSWVRGASTALILCNQVGLNVDRITNQPGTTYCSWSVPSP